MKFKNRVVWITGASYGLGEALAYAFRREGARLILSARKESELERVKRNCPGDESEVVVLPLDLEDTASLAAKAERALAAFGEVDILVNNGGLGARGRAVETPIEVDERIMRINYLGQVALTKAILPSMIERGSGQIVVISSLMGMMSVPGGSAYAASKHALHGFFDALRGEVWQNGITVTIVAPGYINTRISYNALRADGTAHGKQDRRHAHAMSPERAAAIIADAVAARKREVYFGRESLAVYAHRFFPGVFHWAVRRRR